MATTASAPVTTSTRTPTSRAGSSTGRQPGRPGRLLKGAHVGRPSAICGARPGRDLDPHPTSPTFAHLSKRCAAHYDIEQWAARLVGPLDRFHGEDPEPDPPGPPARHRLRPGRLPCPPAVEGAAPGQA